MVVTDGFTGNIALKTAEGMARFFSTALRDGADLRPSGPSWGALMAVAALQPYARQARPQRRQRRRRCSA